MPSFAAPAFGDPTPFEHKMRATALAQHVAHAESSLSAADNQGVHTLHEHGRSPLLMFVADTAHWMGALGNQVQPFCGHGGCARLACPAPILPEIAILTSKAGHARRRASPRRLPSGPRLA